MDPPGRALPLQDKLCILIWALMLVYGRAEQEYFIQDSQLTWDEASNHCQSCFKELVTLTPLNIQVVTQILTTDSWIGLRKYFLPTNGSACSTSMPWTHWANGDPISFQNWYPGRPVFEARCASTCPTLNETDFPNATMAPAECMRPPMLSSTVLEIENTEDSCVVMLRSGLWVEMSCLERLPFICYDDRFYGRATVTNVTTASATLAWLPAPGIITSYRVEVTVDRQTTQAPTRLTSDLFSLTAGTRYSVKVFAVKCTRDLNPQEVSFYTTPSKVKDLRVIHATETSVHLGWSEPDGNADFYVVDVHGSQSQSNTTSAVVGGLTPGRPHTFTVLAAVQGTSTRSGESSLTAYTRPGKVTSLSVSENCITSLLLSWSLPEGNATAFLVLARNDINHTIEQKVDYNTSQSRQEVRVTGLTTGSRITLSVTALANGSLEGDETTIVNYTAPGAVLQLSLETTNDSLTASWTPSVGNYTSFVVMLDVEGQNLDTIEDLKEPVKRFVQLKSAEEYTVTVYSAIGRIRGPPVKSSKFTSPNPPTTASVVSASKSHITFKWEAPKNTMKPSYSVGLHSEFWGHSLSVPQLKETTYTFANLKSGTTYAFEVRTVAAGNQSSPLTMSHPTVADVREINLSMMCSSAELLLCANKTTEESLFLQLEAHFKDFLGDSIFWDLERQKSENAP